MGESPIPRFRKNTSICCFGTGSETTDILSDKLLLLQTTKKYAKVCTAWKNSILASKKLINGCDKYYFQAHRYEEYVDFIQYGFLSVLERIKIG